MNPDQYTFIATAAKGMEQILADELNGLGSGGISVSTGRAVCGSYGSALRAASGHAPRRVILEVVTLEAAEKDDVYSAARSIPWEEHWAAPSTIAVDFSGTCPGINNTMYGAQLVKDALVDRVRERTGKRPSVDAINPGLRVICHLHGGTMALGMDLSGDGLHRRGYREETVAAPIRETLAAAILLKAGWPEVAAGGGSFLDPMAGSGTFVIEAALMAADSALACWAGGALKAGRATMRVSGAIS